MGGWGMKRRREEATTTTAMSDNDEMMGKKQRGRRLRGLENVRPDRDTKKCVAPSEEEEEAGLP